MENHVNQNTTNPAMPTKLEPDEKASLSIRTAEKWARNMQNEDGTIGPHWRLDQTEQVRSQRGISCDPTEFWIAMNMIYSDYSNVFQTYGVREKIFLYADMAQAFLKDKDAKPGKLARYFEYVVNC